MLLAATGVLGLLASRFFESGLRVEPAFAASIADYFLVGRRALLPVAIRLDADRGSRRSAGRSHGTGTPVQWSSSSTRVVTERAVGPGRQAGLIVCAGARISRRTTWTITCTTHSRRLRSTRARISWTCPYLVRDGRPIHRRHAWWPQRSSASCDARNLVLGFPDSKSVPQHPHFFGRWKWAAIVIAFLVIVIYTCIGPFIWDAREVVLLKDQPAFVIGSSGDEPRLFKPGKGERRSERVRKDSPDLRRNVTQRALFDALPSDLNAK